MHPTILHIYIAGYASYVTVAPTAPDGTPRVITATRGLRAYAGRDIEFDPGITSSMGLITRTLDMMSYLVDSGAILNEGETLGEDHKPEFLVRLHENGVLGDGPVYRITEAARSAH